MSTIYFVKISKFQPRFTGSFDHWSYELIWFESSWFQFIFGLVCSSFNGDSSLQQRNKIFISIKNDQIAKWSENFKIKCTGFPIGLCDILPFSLPHTRIYIKLLRELHTSLKINHNHDDSNHINSYDQWSNEPINLDWNFNIITKNILDNTL